MHSGEVALAGGQFMTALEAFTQANALRNRTSPEAWLGMARASYGQGVFGESLRSADRALKHATDDPTLQAAIYDQRGLSLSAMATGPDDPRLSDAARNFQSAVDLDPQLSTAVYHRGVALMAAYRDDEGVADLRRYLNKVHGGSEVEAAKRLVDSPRRARERFAAPRFSLTTPEGKAVSSAGLTGKVVVLDFWGTWCAPCRANTPGLVKLYEKYKHQPVVFIGVGVGEKSIDRWRTYVAEHGMSWVHALDTGKPDEIAQRFHVLSIPDYVVIDGDGIIRARLQEWGAEGPVALEASIRKALAVASREGSRSLQTSPGFFHAVSPDGRSIGYIDRGELIVSDLRTGEIRKLTTRAAKDVRVVSHFVWAASGREIFYQRFTALGADAELFGVRLEDGQSRVIGPRRNYRGIADSSPDGREVLAWIAGDERLRQLSLVSVEDGSMQKLLDINANSAKFSPDARYIAYDRRPPGGGTADIHILTRDGAADHAVFVSPAHERFLDWTPDGRSVLFASDRAGTNDIWIVDVEAGRPQGEPRLLRKNVGEISSLGLSTVGDLFFRVWTKPQLFTVALDAATGMPLARPVRVAAANIGGHGAPTWSPDGRELLFKARTRDDVDDWQALTILTIGSMATRTIVPEMPTLDGQTAAGTPGWLDWSREHRLLLVDGAQYPFGPRPKGAYTVDLVGDGDAMMVVSKPHKTVAVNQAKWLAGGRRVIYLESWTGVVVRDLETGTEQRLYDSKATNPTLDSLAISPDRKFIAFRDHRHGKVLVMPVSGGDARVLASAKGPQGWPASALTWTADGRFVIFTDRADQHHELWRAPVAGGFPVKLGLSLDREVDSIAMSPDGRTLAITMADGEDPPGIRVLDRLVPPAR
jgi:Tol biopolymer transport system component/thiol-disulfide isomerase/thioredoxin